jgi:hypothetical protein
MMQSRGRARPHARFAVSHMEREARRLGWHPASEITWREFLEQYPYGVEELRGGGDRLTHAA